MKKILKSKKGVTILEGLIALALLALVATGTFAVLLSASRTSSQPDIREEMALAVEKAAQKLQVYVYPDGFDPDDVDDISTAVTKGLCGTQDALYVLDEGEHNIDCLLPPICDANNSSFTYTVDNLTTGLPKTTSSAIPMRTFDQMQKKNADGNNAGADINGEYARTVTFEITCNGFTL